MALNFDSVSINGSRVSFSGLGTGIDFTAAVDGIVAAKAIPIDTLESRVTANTTKIEALRELRTTLNTLNNSIDGMRGAVTLGDSSNTFAAKQAFSSTSRTDGVTPSAAGNLVGVTVDNSASVGAHDLEVRRIAAAHKISGNTFASLSSALSLSGSFSIAGPTATASITVQSSDSLADIRDRINSANSGTDPTNVTASIVSVSSTEHILVLTNDDLGRGINIFDSGTVLSSLGISSNNGVQSIRNGLAAGSKVEAGDGFAQFTLSSNSGDTAYKVSFDSATNIMTLTRGDGEADTATLSGATIASGDTETALFEKFGVSLTLDSSFDKDSAITVAADVSSVTAGTGVITDSTIKISDSSGDISGITGSTLTFGNLAAPAAISITVGAFSGSFDGTSTGTKTVNLTDGTNTLQIQFDVGTVFDGNESAASITLNEMQNLVTFAGAFTTVLQRGETARLTADGLSDATHHESARVASSSVALASFLTDATYPGSFDINGSSTETINYTSTTTLDQLATLINAETGTTGVTANVVIDGSGFRLDMDSSSAFTLTDTSNLLDDLGVNDDLVVERSTNTVSDIFTGVTLSLFASEVGTTVKVEVEQNLTTVKTAITSFVDSYNALRKLVNEHTKIESSTGLAAEDAGALFGTSLISDVRGDLATIMGGNTAGVTNDFATLASIGIDFVDNNALSDPLDKDTLEIDTTELDTKLLSNIDDVRRMFAFDFTSSDPDIVRVGFSNKTTHATAGYTLNVGTFGNLHHDSAGVNDQNAVLNTADSFNATTSGSFDINGVTVAYDVTTDTMTNLLGAINNAMIAAGNGITARREFDVNGKAIIALTSTSATIVTDNDTGDLLALLNFTADTGELDSANIGGDANGADNSTITTSGKSIEITSGSTAEGLKLFYTGPGSESAITLNFTVGLATRMSHAIDSFADTLTGAIETEIDSLEAQNKQANERIEDMSDRLVLLRESLTQRFIAMETAVAAMTQILDTIKQQFEAMTADN
ncbi:MAG: flagellar filament capping protein FliD [Rhodospirillales bacterium]|jgi:flagellar capping protein FliD|nr:flagellar filament capping protein FliD [Rhodospirillales bacterium]